MFSAAGLFLIGVSVDEILLLCIVWSHVDMSTHYGLICCHGTPSSHVGGWQWHRVVLYQR